MGGRRSTQPCGYCLGAKKRPRNREGGEKRGGHPSPGENPEQKKEEGDHPRVSAEALGALGGWRGSQKVLL